MTSIKDIMQVGVGVPDREKFATFARDMLGLPTTDSPERKFFRDGYKDPQAQWTSTYTNYGAFGYNSRAVAKTNVPRSFSDLLKPEWKGQDHHRSPRL
jgi:hypothetical protein